jgi:alpha-amylase/alpha-mannosidase (GH57 family)
MKFIFVFHANLNYSNLVPEKFDFVCRASYGRLAEFFNDRYPGEKWCYEASGFTLDYMAEHTPEVLEGLKKAYRDGNCELVGSPYAHSILTAFPYEDGFHALKFGVECWQKHFGIRPAVGWNPEGCWRNDVPEMYKAAGYSAIIADYDSYVQTKTGITLPATHTHSPEEIDKILSIEPSDPVLHFPSEVIPGIKAITRTDRVSVRTLKYFIGEQDFGGLIETIDRYSTGEGYLTLFAEDAEYVGTTAWYHLKYHGLSRLFEDNPGSFDRLAKLIDALKERGELITCSQALEMFPTAEEPLSINEGFAWHHNKTTDWEDTPQAIAFKPKIDEVREAIRSAEKKAASDEDKQKVLKAWWHLVQGENSDGIWPKPPHKPADFNVKFCDDHLNAANDIAQSILGG